MLFDWSLDFKACNQRHIWAWALFPLKPHTSPESEGATGSGAAFWPQHTYMYSSPRFFFTIIPFGKDRILSDEVSYLSSQIGGVWRIGVWMKWWTREAFQIASLRWVVSERSKFPRQHKSGVKVNPVNNAHEMFPVTAHVLKVFVDCLWYCKVLEFVLVFYYSECGK